MREELETVEQKGVEHRSRSFLGVGTVYFSHTSQQSMSSVERGLIYYAFLKNCLIFFIIIRSAYFENVTFSCATCSLVHL